MKFRSREKLKYMFLGGLLTLAGFMLGNMNSETTAQSGYETICSAYAYLDHNFAKLR